MYNNSFLDKILISYIILGILLYSILFICCDYIYIEYNILNVFTFASYAFVLYLCNRMPEEFFTSSSLLFIVIIYIVIFLSLYSLLSDMYVGDTYLFGPPDQRIYSRGSLFIKDMSFVDGIKYLSRKYRYEDLGAFLMFSSMLKIIPSKYFVDICYVMMGVVSSLCLFDIGKKMMTPKYAFMASLVYAIGSYSIFYYGSFLKETGMLFIIIVSFTFFYNYINYNRPILLLLSILFAVLLIFFRPIILAFLFISYFSYFLIDRKKNNSSLLIFFIFVALFICVFGTMSEAINRYTHGGNLENTQNYINATKFTILASTISVLIGPFPQLINTRDFLYFIPINGAGLLFKFILFLPFWKGCIYFFRNRIRIVAPLFIFCLLEMIGLAVVNDGIELRKALPHLPFLIMMAFWFLCCYDEKVTSEIKRSAYYKITEIEFGFCLIVVFISTLAWNMLR